MARAPILHPHGPCSRGLFHARAGLVTASLDYLTDGPRPEGGSHRPASTSTLLSATGIDCRLARGELALARPVGEQLGRWLELPGLAGATAHYGRGELSAAIGEVDRAADHFARPAASSGGEDDPDVLPWRTAAAVASVRLGHRVEAIALARAEHLVLAGAADAAYSVAVGLRTLATVAAHRDPADLLRASTELRRRPGRPAAAQLDTDLAGLLLLAGGPSVVRLSPNRPTRRE